jgi:CDP-diacylglycerol--glycerol-3-phosphate 3-phosphatidyltransferase
MLNMPLRLTLLRVGLIPLFIVLYYLPFAYHYQYAAFIFALAAFTDWLDGFLARKMKQTTDVGAFLDPIADKLLVTAALILLVAHYQNMGLTFAAFVIVAREITVSALREWMALRRLRVNVQLIAKIKTAIQLVAITAMILNCSQHLYLSFWLSYFLLYTAVSLTLWSMFIYLRAALPTLKESTQNQTAASESG